MYLILQNITRELYTGTAELYIVFVKKIHYRKKLTKFVTQSLDILKFKITSNCIEEWTAIIIAAAWPPLRAYHDPSRV